MSKQKLRPASGQVWKVKKGAKIRFYKDRQGRLKATVYGQIDVSKPNKNERSA